MARLLFIGDVHAVVSELDDCERLFDLVADTVIQYRPDAVVHLGDGFHTHAVIHAEVVDFWKRVVKRISDLGPEVVWVLGNHETTGVHGSAVNALQVLEGNPVTCVVKPMIWNGFLMVPYQDRQEDFVRVTRSYSVQRAIVHQSFQGAQFENGFYDPSGVDADLIPQVHIVSGHIHNPQRLGDKIWYPGAPRWRTLGDANTARAIYICDYDDYHVGPANTISIPTDTHCRAIFTLDDRPGEPVVVPSLPPGAPDPRIHVDVYGSPDHVRERKSYFEDTGYRVRTFPDQVKKSLVRESEGISVAIQKYVRAYVPKNGTSNTALEGLLKERLPCLMK